MKEYHNPYPEHTLQWLIKDALYAIARISETLEEDCGNPKYFWFIVSPTQFDQIFMKLVFPEFELSLWMPEKQEEILSQIREHEGEETIGMLKGVLQVLFADVYDMEVYDNFSNDGYMKLCNNAIKSLLDELGR